MSKVASVMLSSSVLAALYAVATLHSVAQISDTSLEEKAAVSWVRLNAIPLKTLEAGNGFADMEPLDKVVGDARIVALGEATHGTREFFPLKHRMIEYLATRKGFTIFSIEANMPEAYRLNKFVLEGEGDPKQLLKGMYFWTWNTEEVLDMILWMREFNRSGKGRIEFTGFDMQTPTVSIETVRGFLLARDAAHYHSTVEVLYKQVPDVKERITQQPFAVATATLPGNLIAGKHVTVSGYMRSESIADGYAGLWMNVVGGPKGSLGFKNLGDKNITGTGSYLRQMYGKQLVNFGFAFNQGSFRAVEPGKSLHDFTVPPAPEGTLGHALAATSIPLLPWTFGVCQAGRPRPNGLPSLISHEASARPSAIRWSHTYGGQGPQNQTLTFCSSWRRPQTHAGIAELH